MVIGTDLRLVVVWHLVDGLPVDDGRLVKTALVGVQPPHVEEGRDLGGLVRLWIFEAVAVQTGALSVHLDSLRTTAHLLQGMAQIQVSN